MKYVLNILFVAVLIATVSVDFIIRQLFPLKEVEINLTVSFLAILSLLFFLASFHLMHGSTSRTAMSSKSPRQAQSESPRFIESILSQDDPLLIIRFFAAGLVFLTHMTILLQPSSAIFEGFGRMLLGAAHPGMQIFFTLSGFLMGKPL